MSDVSASLGVNNAEFKTGLAEARNAVREFKDEVVSSFAGYLTFQGIKEAITSTLEYGAQVKNLSERFDVGTEPLQRWGFAAKANGLYLEDVAQAFNRLEVARSRALQGDDKMVDAFRNLNVSVADLKNLSPDQLMKKIGGSTLDAADMVAVFGRNGNELVPMLAKVASGAQDLGDAMSDDVVNGLASANDALDKFQDKLKVMSGNLVAKAVLPGINQFQGNLFQFTYDFNTMLNNLGTAAKLRMAQLSPDRATRDKAAKDYRDFISGMLAEEATAVAAFKKENDGSNAPGYDRPPPRQGDDDEKKTRSLRERIPLAERLAQIDGDAAAKKLSIEEQIRRQQSEQEIARLTLSNNPADQSLRDQLEETMVRTETEIQRLREEGTRADADAQKKNEDARIQAEEDYQRLKEENANKELARARDEAESPVEKARVLDDQAKQIEDKIAALKQQLKDLQDSPEGRSADGPLWIETMKSKILDAQQALDDVRRDRREVSKERETTSEQGANGMGYDSLSQIGIRAAGVDYRSAGGTKHLERISKNTEDDAYYTRKIYEQGEVGQGSATFAGNIMGGS